MIWWTVVDDWYL